MSVRFLSDEDFDNDILRGVLHRNAEVDLVRVQDVGLSGADDQDILEWAAQHGRVLLTHDVSTMKTHALARIQSGLAMPGIFVANQSAPIGKVISDIVLIAECSLKDEWEGQIRYLPL